MNYPDTSQWPDINQHKDYFDKISLSEGDIHEFFHLGFNCQMVRGHAKSWCGYILLPEEHDYYGVSYNDLPVKVHGGLTYSEFFNQNGYVFWMIGFDCAHNGDFTYYSLSSIRGGGVGQPDIYRTKDYVIGELKSLASQMITKKWNRHYQISKIL